MGQGPAREGVGGEPGVHQRQGAFEALVAEIREKGLDLGCGQHPLVDDRPRREGGEVDAAVLVLNPLAQDEGPALEVQSGGSRVALATKIWWKDGMALRAMLPTGEGSIGHLPPAQHGQLLVGGQPLDRRARARAASSAHRRAGRRYPWRRRRPPAAPASHLPVEAVRDLEQDAGAVAGVDLGAGRAPVLEVAQAGQAHAHDVVAAPAVHVHDERHPARVVLELGAVQVQGASFRGSWLTGPRMKGRRWPLPPLQDRRRARVPQAVLPGALRSAKFRQICGPVPGGRSGSRRDESARPGEGGCERETGWPARRWR